MGNDRRSDRFEVSVEVTIRRAGVRGYRVRAHDLSLEGCRIEFVERPAIGERVWIKFDNLEAIEGSVRWVAGHVGGVRFERPLHDAVLAQLKG